MSAEQELEQAARDYANNQAATVPPPPVVAPNDTDPQQ